MRLSRYINYKWNNQKNLLDLYKRIDLHYVHNEYVNDTNSLILFGNNTTNNIYQYIKRWLLGSIEFLRKNS